MSVIASSSGPASRTTSSKLRSRARERAAVRRAMASGMLTRRSLMCASDGSGAVTSSAANAVRSCSGSSSGTGAGAAPASGTRR